MSNECRTLQVKVSNVGIIKLVLMSHRKAAHVLWHLVVQLLSVKIEVKDTPFGILAIHSSSQHLIINIAEVVNDRQIVIHHGC